MAIHIEEIAFGSETYNSLLKLRYEILRKPRGIELSEKDTSGDDSKFHLAAWDGEKPIGCLLLKPLDAHRLHLQQMAILQHYRGQGIGARLIRFAEALAAARGYTIIEMHANKAAWEFYKKLGYAEDGEEFTENAVSSRRMLKQIA